MYVGLDNELFKMQGTNIKIKKNIKSFYVIQTEVVGVCKAFCGSFIFVLTEFTQIIKNFISYRTISNCSLHYNDQSVNSVRRNALFIVRVLHNTSTIEK